MSRSALEALALSMLRDSTPIPIKLIQGHGPPPIATTYFGQFVDHDLTFDSTPLRDAGECEAIYTLNNRTPWLDLDHLYGDGPGSTRHGHLYESDHASFRLGYSPSGGEPFDIPVTSDGLPLVVDERNAENLIIRQIHAMFLKLHNVAVREIPVSRPPRERFDRARDRVRWQYQWLVRNWYLGEICDPETYRAIIKKKDRRIDWQRSGFAIPLEFAVAGMRFGHSMVRAEYQLNAIAVEDGGSGTVDLADLFGVNNNRDLSPSLKIDWALLSKRGAMSIDTALVRPLFHLPDESIDPYVRTPRPHPPQALAIRTLLRGAALRLPTGQQVRQALGVKGAISPTPAEYKTDPWDVLRKLGLDQDVPLWYYILLEAQLDQTGAYLGTLGSRLVTECIEGALSLDRSSFLLRQPSGWVPDPWPTAAGARVPINSLLDVARVVAA